MCVAIYQSASPPSHPAAQWKKPLGVLREKSRPTDDIMIYVRSREVWYGGTLPWGYPVKWNEGNKLLLYARVESIQEKPFWSRWMPCAIPALGFIERNTVASGVKYYRFSAQSDMWLAGLWHKDDDGNPKMVVVTQKPSAIVAAIHDRMPVCMEPAFLETWFSSKKCPRNVFPLEASPLDKL